MTRGLAWILLIYFLEQSVSSRTPDELLLALKQEFADQPDCTPMFEIRHPGFISSNAIGYPSITTDDECRSTCIKDENCMSYQVDPTPGKIFCRIQTSYSIETLQGPFNGTNIKEYVFTVKCVNSTSAGNGNAGQCTILIEIRLRNWNSHRARELPSVKSEMECRAICINDQDCMSYQIDRGSKYSLCYIQKHLEMFNKYLLYMTKLVKEYVIVDRCSEKYDVTYQKGCFPVFKKLYQDVSTATKPYPFVTTEQLCRLTCLFTPDCVSYQIDRNPGALFCSTQLNVNNLSQGKRTKRYLVTEYVLVNPCTNKPFDKSAPDCIVFEFPKPYPGISFYAQSHAEVKTYADCRSLCLANPACVSYQNSSTGTLCWTQTDWKSLLPNNAYTSTEYINEYVVARRCSKGPLVTIDEGNTIKPEIHVDNCNQADLRNEIDLVFAICTAGIIKGDIKSEERLYALKTFVSAVVNGLNVASNRDRVALVTFENKAYVEFNLNTYNDQRLLVEAIAKFGCHECSTKEKSVISPLATIKTEVLSKPNGYRPDVAHVIILVTDRLPTVDLEARDAVVRELVNAGTYIIPIGITDMVDGDKLKGFASPKFDGKPQDLLWVNNFIFLNTLASRVHDTIRQVLPLKYLRFCLK